MRIQILILGFKGLTPWEHCRTSFCLLLDQGEDKEALYECFQALEVTAVQTSGILNLVFSHQTGNIKSEHPFIYKLMVVTEPAVPSTWLLGLGSNCILATSSACSTKIWHNSCRVFVSITPKIEQAKERFCWQGKSLTTCNYVIQAYTHWVLFFFPASETRCKHSVGSWKRQKYGTGSVGL